MSEPTVIPGSWSRYRAYLQILARAGLQQRLRVKVDPSDLVQQTLVQAVESLDDFRGTTDAEMLGWLRRILVNRIAQTAREFARDKRDVSREIDIQKSVDSSAMSIERLARANDTSPSDRLIKAELILKVAEALERLPEGQRQAIVLHHWQGLPVSGVAKKMDRTTTAVAGLLKRGLKNVRNVLRAADEST